MENQDQSTEPTNVVSIFAGRQPQSASADVENDETKTDEEQFSEAMRRNEENRRRMAQERLKANKGVLKSYRIKKK